VPIDSLSAKLASMLRNSRFEFAMVFLLLVTPIIAKDPALAGQNGDSPQYASFRALFRPARFKPIFLSAETPANGMTLDGTALAFFNSRIPSPQPPFLIPPFEPVSAFSFADKLEAFLVRGSSELNDKNISLVIFREDGQLMDIQLIAGRKGDEGYYDEQFGWIRDLNNDGVPDLLIGEQLARPSKDSSYDEFESRPLRQKTWNGRRFVVSRFPISPQTTSAIQEDLGTFRLQQFQRWDSDPRSRSAAIHSYELWIKTYPGHSQMAKARSKLQQFQKN
jgi:hypothetical protein